MTGQIRHSETVSASALCPSMHIAVYFPSARLVALGRLDVRNLFPDLRVQDRAEVVAKLAVKVVKPFVRLKICCNFDASVLLQRRDVGPERLGEGDEGAVLEPPGVVVDSQEDADVVGGVGHTRMPGSVSDRSKV